MWQHFKFHQPRCGKQLLDPDEDQVMVKRFRCLRCKHTFRVYPKGVSRAQRSDRLKAIGVMYHVLGMSYGAVEDALSAHGWAGSTSSVYRDVQAAGEAAQRIQKAQGKRKVQVAGADATFVICNREQGTIAADVDALEQSVLEIELVDAESVDALRLFLQELVETFEIKVLLSDDQDSYKQLSDELDIQHSVCRAHVNRNVAKLVAALGERALRHPDPIPGGPEGQRLDCTNNATERIIGWWIKERYRTMRTYKRPQSVLNVSRLIAYLGSNANGPALANLYLN